LKNKAESEFGAILLNRDMSKPEAKLDSRQIAEESQFGRTGCYWVQVFSEETWREFLIAGAKVTGFREKRWVIVKKIKPGDRLLCYISKIGVLIAVLQATAEPYLDHRNDVFKDAYPCRVPVRVVVRLDERHAIPIKTLDTLSIFKSRSWGAHFLASPSKFAEKDAAIVLRELKLVRASKTK
jgi:predicted RNA-binding protein